MNTGIQDATNLAWKVALAVSGGVDSAPKLLQTYHEERHPAGEEAVRFSGGTSPAAAVGSWRSQFSAPASVAAAVGCMLALTN